MVAPAGSSRGSDSTLPQHGGRKQLGKGLWSKILKDLALKEDR
jgi:mRNA interferase HicA